jgi:hypothetical protein
MQLLYPEDVDQRLSWPLGRAVRLARQRRLPHVLLPDGSIRFRWTDIEPLVLSVPPAVRHELNAITARKVGEGVPEG